jgi:hypothetical protein
LPLGDAIFPFHPTLPEAITRYTLFLPPLDCNGIFAARM